MAQFPGSVRKKVLLQLLLLLCHPFPVVSVCSSHPGVFPGTGGCVFCALVLGVAGAWASSRKVGLDPGGGAAFLCLETQQGGQCGWGVLCCMDAWVSREQWLQSDLHTFFGGEGAALEGQAGRTVSRPTCVLTQTVHLGRTLGRGLRGGSWKSPLPK